MEYTVIKVMGAVLELSVIQVYPILMPMPLPNSVS